MASKEEKLAFRDKCEEHLKDAIAIRNVLSEQLVTAEKLKYITAEAALETSIWYKYWQDQYDSLSEQISMNPGNKSLTVALDEATSRLAQWGVENSEASNEAMLAAKEVDILRTKSAGLERVIDQLYKDTGRTGILWSIFKKKQEVLPTPWDVRPRDYHPESRNEADTLSMSSEAVPAKSAMTPAVIHGLEGLHPHFGSALSLATNAMTKTLATFVSNMIQGTLAGAHNPHIYPFFMRNSNYHCQDSRHSHSQLPADGRYTRGPYPHMYGQRPSCYQVCSHIQCQCAANQGSAQYMNHT